MAVVELNPAFKSISGKIGDLTAVKHSDGKIILRKTSTIKHPPTKDQLAHQDRVRKAVQYGKAVLADTELSKIYRAAAKKLGKRAFNLAFRDFFRPPEVVEIDPSACTGKPGEMIGIEALDDFEVVSVRVEVKDVSGDIIEEGLAKLESESRWIYTTQKAISADTRLVIAVTAEDRAGNTGGKIQHWLTGNGDQ